MGKIADFSHHQGDVNWQKVATELDLAILRVQYGTSLIDRKYREYAAGCKANQIPFGLYAYCLFSSTAEAVREAEVFHSRADKAALFLVADIEEQTTRSPADMAPAAQAFLDTLKSKGWKVGLYTGNHTYEPLQMDRVKADFVWIPRYGANRPAFLCDLWQYTETGSLAGVGGNVDLNRLTGTKPLSFFLGKEAPTPEKPPVSPEPPKAAVPKPAEPAPKPIPPAKVLYTVKKGDTLSGIAARYNVTTAALQSANAIKNANNILSGQQLTIPLTAGKPAAAQPVYHFVTAGDTVGKLAIQYGSSQEKIKDWNSLKNINQITAGQKLRVK